MTTAPIPYGTDERDAPELTMRTLYLAWQLRGQQLRRSRRRVAAVVGTLGLVLGVVSGVAFERVQDAQRDRAACEFVAAELGRSIASTCP